MKAIKFLVRHWNHFWFAPMDLYNVALCRCLLAGTWLVMYSIRLKDFSVFYGDDALIPGELGNLIMPPSFQSPFSLFFAGESAAYFAHWVYVILLAGLFLGLFGRSLTWLVFLLHLGFMQRNYAVVYGADLFTNFWLLYLSLVTHNRYFSVLNLFRKDGMRWLNLPRLDSDTLSTVGVRLLQVQLCISYAFTGIEKLKGAYWWEGVAVWHVLGMQELMSVDLTFLQSFPMVIGLLTIATVIFEIYFPAAMLGSIRPYWLLIGVGFHGMTGVFMNLPYFCLVMICPYLLFVHSKTLRFFIHRHSLVRRWRPQS